MCPASPPAPSRQAAAVLPEEASLSPPALLQLSPSTMYNGLSERALCASKAGAGHIPPASITVPLLPQAVLSPSPLGACHQAHVAHSSHSSCWSTKLQPGYREICSPDLPPVQSTPLPVPLRAPLTCWHHLQLLQCPPSTPALPSAHGQSYGPASRLSPQHKEPARSGLAGLVCGSAELSEPQHEPRRTDQMAAHSLGCPWWILALSLLTRSDPPQATTVGPAGWPQCATRGRGVQSIPGKGQHSPCMKGKKHHKRNSRETNHR